MKKNYKIKVLYALMPISLCLFAFIPYDNDKVTYESYSIFNRTLHNDYMGEKDVITWSDFKDEKDIKTKKTWGFIETSLVDIGIENESEDIKSIIESYN